jgi:hypothetical protein
MSFMARIEGPGQDRREAQVDFSPAATWTTQDLIMAGEHMRELVPGTEADWSWGYERLPQGVVITVKVAGGTVIQSAPLDVPDVVVPADEPPHWFGDPVE